MSSQYPGSNEPNPYYAPPPPPPSYNPAMPATGYAPAGVVVTGGTSGLAITSLVLALVSFCGFGILTSVPAVICGHIALGRINQSNGAIGGRGLALAGLIIGYIVIAINIIVLIMLIAAPGLLTPSAGQ